MPRNPHARRCSEPGCKAWAIHGSDLCSAHAGRTADAAGPPQDNKNAVQHSFYSSALDPSEIADLVLCASDLSLDDEIALARVACRRLMSALSGPNLAPQEAATLAAVALGGTRTVARLLRDKRALSGEAADGIAGAIASALDELSTEWGVRL
jgi:hypothetical protein